MLVQIDTNSFDWIDEERSTFLYAVDNAISIEEQILFDGKTLIQFRKEMKSYK